MHLSHKRTTHLVYIVDTGIRQRIELSIDLIQQTDDLHGGVVCTEGVEITDATEQNGDGVILDSLYRLTHAEFVGHGGRQDGIHLELDIIL